MAKEKIGELLKELELEGDSEELVLDTRDAIIVPDGWFSRFEPAPPQPQGAPRRPPASRARPPALQPGAPVPQPSPPVLVPVRAPRASSVEPPSSGVAAAAADLDDLLGVDSRSPNAPAASSEQDLSILRALERLARGEEPAVDSPKLRAAQMVASLIQLLLRKGVISHAELLAELRQK